MNALCHTTQENDISKSVSTINLHHELECVESKYILFFISEYDKLALAVLDLKIRKNVKENAQQPCNFFKIKEGWNKQATSINGIKHAGSEPNLSPILSVA